MVILEWFFAFHPVNRSTYREWFGHVEAFGYTADETWLFFDPQMGKSKVLVTHLYDEVRAQIAARFQVCRLVLKIQADERETRVPIGAPMTCATACGHLIGLRAFTPKGLERRLLANGAEVLHGRPTRGSGRRGGQPASAARGTGREHQGSARECRGPDE